MLIIVNDIRLNKALTSWIQYIGRIAKRYPKRKKHKEFTSKCLIFIGAPRVIRTPDLRIRSPLRYPAALWAQK